MMADDQTPEREIYVNGRIPGGKYFIDLDYIVIEAPHPTRPGKTIQKLDRIILTRKAESTHQEAVEESLGSFRIRC